MMTADPAMVAALVGSTDTLRSRIVDAVRRDHRTAWLVTDRDAGYLLSLLLRRANGKVVGTSTEEDRRLAEIGATLARKSYRSADLAVAYRVPLRVIVDHVRKVGVEIGRRPAEMIGTIHVLLDACNTVAGAVADGYHRTEHHRARAEFLRELLFGGLDAAELVPRLVHHGLDAGREYLAFRARPVNGVTTGELAGLPMFRRAGSLHASIGADLVGILSAVPTAFDGGVCGVGPPRPPGRLADSFRMATRALDAADRLGATGVHEFTELGLLPAISSDAAVSEALHRRYLAPLGSSESAAEIADTLRAYLVADRHVGRTAEHLFVHPNTVRYRIKRFEELTGVSLRGSSTVVFEVLWALEHREPASEPRRPRPH